MKFLHLTDIHFLREYPKAERGYDAIFGNMTSPIEQLKQGLKRIDVNTLDAVLITGDLVECGDALDYRQLKAELEVLFGEIPLVVTLGNHDIKQAFYEGWLELAEQNNPYHTITTIKDVTIIGLDNSDEVEQTGVLTKAHCEWLEKALKQSEGSKVILMFHHHLIPEQATIPAVGYYEDFYQMIQRSNVMGILCGHTHHAYQGTFADKPYFTADNLSFSGEDEGNGIVRFEERSGFNYCEVQDGQLHVEVIKVLDQNRLLTTVDFKK
ncbi:MAG: metallophosphoesterase family protein [Cellulosilyticaceae bacterium]